MDLDCLLKTFRSRRLGYGHGHNAKSAIPVLWYNRGKLSVYPVDNASLRAKVARQ